MCLDGVVDMVLMVLVLMKWDEDNCEGAGDNGVTVLVIGLALVMVMGGLR